MQGFFAAHLYRTFCRAHIYAGNFVYERIHTGRFVERTLRMFYGDLIAA